MQSTKRIKSRKSSDIHGWKEAVKKLKHESNSPGCRVLRNPILFATTPEGVRPEGPSAHGYLTFAPKTFCFALCNASGELNGICAFSRDACGPPRRAHGGAIAAFLDNAMGVCSIEFDGVSTLTRNFSIRYRRPVPIEEILVFSCKLSIPSGSITYATVGKSPKGRQRLVVEGEIRAGPGSELYEEGELLARAIAVFSKTKVQFLDEEVYANAVERRWANGPPPFYEYEDLTVLPWGIQADSLASRLCKTHRPFNFREEFPELIDSETDGVLGYGEDCTPFEMSDLPPP